MIKIRFYGRNTSDVVCFKKTFERVSKLGKPGGTIKEIRVIIICFLMVGDGSFKKRVVTLTVKKMSAFVFQIEKKLVICRHLKKVCF